MNDPTYLAPENLTFPGVGVVGGILPGFILAQTGGPPPWIALGVAIVFGAFITWLGAADLGQVTNSFNS